MSATDMFLSSVMCAYVVWLMPSATIALTGSTIHAGITALDAANSLMRYRNLPLPDHFSLHCISDGYCFSSTGTFQLACQLRTTTMLHIRPWSDSARRCHIRQS